MKAFLLLFALFGFLHAENDLQSKLICGEDMKTYDYCPKLLKYHYVMEDDLDSILYMTDDLEYLNDIRNRLSRDLSNKIFKVMTDISKTIKIATNEVRKQKYKNIGMVVLPVKYGSNMMLKYRKKSVMIRGELRKYVKDFYKQYRKFDDEFLTDVLTANDATFIVLPEIVQYDEMKNSLYETKEAKLQIAIDGFFGLEKGMSEAIVTLELKIDKNKKIRRLNDRKTEYEMIKKAIIELIDNALGDIASQEE